MIFRLCISYIANQEIQENIYIVVFINKYNYYIKTTLVGM